MSVKLIGKYTPGGRIKIRRAALPPVFVTNPTISHADLYSDSTYTAQDGTFNPANAIVSRKWKLSGMVIGTGGTVVPNTSGSLVLEVTISTSAGKVTLSSDPLTIIVRPPVFTVQPSISPTNAQMGTLFTGNDGKATNFSTITRQWFLNGFAINGQTGPTYLSDGTGSLTVKVTAVGPGGTVTATSPAVTITASPVVQHAPEWKVQPGLLGTFAEGSSVNIPLQATDQENNISTYAVTGGTLPGGLVIDMFSGVISGTLAEVTTDTSYKFEVTVTDRTNLSVKGQFTINVANVKTTVTWNTDNSSDLVAPAPGQSVNTSVNATSS